MNVLTRMRALGTAVLATVALTLAGCTTENAETPESTENSATSEAATEAVTLTDGVVRATVEDNPMTSVFGTLVNHTDQDLNIVALTASAAAASYEIHEVVDGVMQEKEGGITIPAGQSHEMAPGGDHFMFMELADPIAAGDAVTVTLELADGARVELADIPVRTMGAGDEDYGDLGGMEEMEHGSEHGH